MPAPFKFLSAEPVGDDGRTAIAVMRRCCFTDEQYSMQGREELETLVSQGVRVLILNVSGISEAHSYFISGLGRILDRLKALDGSMVICRVEPETARSFDWLRERGCEIVATEQDALGLAVA